MPDPLVDQLRSGAKVLVQRPDLLASECELIQEQRSTWAGRLAELGDYGTSGGSAADRRAVITAMAAIEEVARRG